MAGWLVRADFCGVGLLLLLSDCARLSVRFMVKRERKQHTETERRPKVGSKGLGLSSCGEGGRALGNLNEI